MTTPTELETRLIAVETALHEIQCRLATLQPSPNWLKEIIGSCTDEPAFDEMIALGRACRASQPYPDACNATSAEPPPLPASCMSTGEQPMIQLTIDMPEGALATLHQDPQEFAHALRLAAAVKWYEMRRVSQGRAAEIAGVSRSAFLAALGQFGVSPFQEDAAEILEEATRA
jgi:predicted HTH domain antitoxin